MLRKQHKADGALKLICAAVVGLLCIAALMCVRVRRVVEPVTVASPLLNAIHRNASLEEITKILDKNPELKDIPELPVGRPIDHAAARGRLDVVDLLLSRGSSANGQVMSSPNSYSNLLHSAAIRNDVGLARLLLQYGANPNITDSEGDTPLDLAKAYSSSNVAILLEEWGSEEVKGNRDVPVKQRSEQSAQNTETNQ